MTKLLTSTCIKTIQRSQVTESNINEKYYTAIKQFTLEHYENYNFNDMLTDEILRIIKDDSRKYTPLFDMLYDCGQCEKKSLLVPTITITVDEKYISRSSNEFDYNVDNCLCRIPDADTVEEHFEDIHIFTAKSYKRKDFDNILNSGLTQLSLELSEDSVHAIKDCRENNIRCYCQRLYLRGKSQQAFLLAEDGYYKHDN